ncbi:hypothetical protein J5224_25055, partial [Candidatus Symbiopectobacterium sp. NZEC135]|nr:hypothetical protein [Candidatus Symbiopectobacterium sp. NZEC135]
AVLNSVVIGDATIASAKIKDAAITGAKFSDNISSDNYVAGSSGWKISRASGSSEFNNVIVRGTVYAKDGRFEGTVYADKIEGDVIEQSVLMYNPVDNPDNSPTLPFVIGLNDGWKTWLEISPKPYDRIFKFTNLALVSVWSQGPKRVRVNLVNPDGSERTFMDQYREGGSQLFCVFSTLIVPANTSNLKQKIKILLEGRVNSISIQPINLESVWAGRNGSDSQNRQFWSCSPAVITSYKGSVLPPPLLTTV